MTTNARLLVIAGRAGVGKSTLAARFRQALGMMHVETDTHVDVPGGARALNALPAEPRFEGWTRAYDSAHREAESWLRCRRSVVLSGSYLNEERRRAALAASVRLGVEAGILILDDDEGAVARNFLTREPDDQIDDEASADQGERVRKMVLATTEEGWAMRLVIGFADGAWACQAADDPWSLTPTALPLLGSLPTAAALRASRG